MQINKCLSFKQIMFLNISLNNINKKLIKYKKYNLKNLYIYRYIPLWQMYSEILSYQHEFIVVYNCLSYFSDLEVQNLVMNECPGLKPIFFGWPIDVDGLVNTTKREY